MKQYTQNMLYLRVLYAGGTANHYNPESKHNKNQICAIYLQLVLFWILICQICGITSEKGITFNYRRLIKKSIIWTEKCEKKTSMETVLALMVKKSKKRLKLIRLS